jgi:drug/metabolite transporter (DMT)-like permease
VGLRKERAVHGALADRPFAVAIALMVTAAAFNAVDTLLVRVISTEMSAFSIGFFRSAFGLLFVAPWIYRRRALILSTHYRWMHVARAGLKVLALAAFFYAISRTNLTQVTAIAFTTPIFVTIGAYLLLGERLGTVRVVSVLMGFVGVLLIVRPGYGGLDPYLLFALAAVVLTAVIQLLLKAMAGNDSTEALVVWNLVMMVPLALVPALFFWTTPSPLMLGLLAVQGALGALAMTAITRAVALVDISAVAPFDFLRLPLVALGAYYLFGQSADLGTWIGAAVIFLAGILAGRRPGQGMVPAPAAGEAADIAELAQREETRQRNRGGRIKTLKVD